MRRKSKDERFQYIYEYTYIIYIRIYIVVWRHHTTKKQRPNDETKGAVTHQGSTNDVEERTKFGGEGDRGGGHEKKKRKDAQWKGKKGGDTPR